ncbi:MAG: hypothetical protein AB7W16_00370 [Candidatus Obscuribacterales bacterium]
MKLHILEKSPAHRIALGGLALSLAFGVFFPTATSAEDANGMVVDDNSGSPFMQEVVDPKQQAKEEQERIRMRPIDRHTLSDQELKNVGIQMTPSGSIVPLINRNPAAPAVRPNVSTINQTFQPLPVPVPIVAPVAPILAPRPLPGISAAGSLALPGGVIQGNFSGNLSFPGAVTGYPGVLPTYPYQPFPYGRPPMAGGIFNYGPGGLTGGIGLFGTREVESTTTVTPLLPSWANQQQQ